MDYSLLISTETFETGLKPAFLVTSGEAFEWLRRGGVSRAGGAPRRPVSTPKHHVSEIGAGRKGRSGAIRRVLG
jgi:hypothetical protein